MIEKNIAPPNVLTIAGSDPSGGAGIQVSHSNNCSSWFTFQLTMVSIDQADLKAFTAFGCYGMSVITALTAQNTLGVQGVHPAPPEFVEQQVRTELPRS